LESTGHQIAQILITPTSSVISGDVKGSIHLHLETAVKSVKAHPDCINALHFSNDQVFVLAKNPFVKVYSAQDLTLTELIKVPCLSMCSRMHFEEKTTLVLGFSSLDCIVYDLGRETEILRQETKGGARPIAFNSDRLVWAQTDQMSAKRVDRVFRVVQESRHGREILSVHAVKDLLLTGSEDTTFKVWLQGELVQTYSSQEASIKCFASSGNLVLSAGSKMQAHLHMIPESNPRKLIPLHRYQQKVFQEVKNNGLRELQVEAQDFRIMACALTKANAVLGTSSGHIVLCDLEMKQVHMVEHRECILSMSWVEPFLFVGFTNGCIRVYSIEQNVLSLLQTERVHDFGVNAIDAVRQNETIWLVSGGDDQHVNVMSFEATLKVLTRWQAHQSCVKGVAIYPGEDSFRVCSSGYD
jgi:WD40 repeat protein